MTSMPALPRTWISLFALDLPAAFKWGSWLIRVRPRHVDEGEFELGDGRQPATHLRDVTDVGVPGAGVLIEHVELALNLAV